jgi:hypothetical protein
MSNLLEQLPILEERRYANVISITQLIGNFIRLILIRLNSFRLQTAAQILHSFGRLTTIMLAAKLIYHLVCPLLDHYTTVSLLYLLYPTDGNQLLSYCQSL